MPAASRVAPATPAFTGPPTGRLIARFFWKERRRLTGLALGVGAIALAIMFVMWLLGKEASKPAPMIVVALGASAMMAVAAAVTLFAVEKEEGTADLLRILPENQVGLFLGKVSAAVLSVLVLCSVLAACAYGVSGGWPTGANADLLLFQGATVLAEALVFGLLASLVCPQPLVAAVLGMVLASLNSQAAIALFVPAGRGFEAHALQEALPARWAFIAVVAAVDWWLGTRWLPKAPRSRVASRVRGRESVQPAAMRARRRWLPAFTRLVWQSLRQSWVTALAVTVLGVFLSFSFALVGGQFSGHAIGLLGVLFTPALLGAMVFRADQRREQYRFLAEHAGRPRMLWLARVTTWVVPTLTLCGVACAAGAAFGYGLWVDQNEWRWDYHSQLDTLIAAEVAGNQLQIRLTRADATRLGLLGLASAFVAFAYGAFFSIALKSEILAAMLAMGASIVLAIWASLVGAGGLSTWWFVLPLGVGALFASWLRARDWALERRGLVRWVLPLAALLTPVVVVIGAAPSARLSQVPDSLALTDLRDRSRLDFDEVVLRANEQKKRGSEVADAYRRLAGTIDEMDDGLLTGAPYDELVRLSEEACRLPLAPDLLEGSGGAVEKLQQNLLALGRKERASDLDQRLTDLIVCRRLAIQRSNGRSLTNALEPTYLGHELLDWATAEDQTAERLLAAVEELQRVEEGLLGPSGRLMNEYLRARSVVRGETTPRFLDGGDADGVSKASWGGWLAFLANDWLGESERAERSLRVLGVYWTQYLQGVENDFRERGAGDRSRRWRLRAMNRFRPKSSLTMLAANYQPYGGKEGLMHQAETVRHAQTSYLASQEFPDAWRIRQDVVEWMVASAWLRAERVRLALIAYRLKEGAYPEKLADLSPDFMEPWQYRDPFSNEPFGYAPEGFAYRSKDRWWRHSLYDNEGGLPPGTPTLWSRGSGEAEPTVMRVHYEWDEDGALSEKILDEGDPDPETGEIRQGIVLQPQLRFWNSQHFFMPLPR